MKIELSWEKAIDGRSPTFRWGDQTPAGYWKLSWCASNAMFDLRGVSAVFSQIPLSFECIFRCLHASESQATFVGVYEYNMDIEGYKKGRPFMCLRRGKWLRDKKRKGIIGALADCRIEVLFLEKSTAKPGRELIHRTMKLASRGWRLTKVDRPTDPSKITLEIIDGSAITKLRCPLGRYRSRDLESITSQWIEYAFSINPRSTIIPDSGERFTAYYPRSFGEQLGLANERPAGRVKK